MVSWIIQDSFVPYGHSDALTSALDALGTSYQGYGVIPFTEDFTGLDDIDHTKRYVLRGTTKVLKNLYLNPQDTPLHKTLLSSIFYDLDSFDQMNYKEKVKVFNSVAEYIDFKDIDKYAPSYPYFAKPSSDLKFFAGIKVDCGKTIKSALDERKSLIDSNIPDSFKIMICPLKNSLGKEYRCFVVDGKITSISKYFDKGRLSKSDCYPPHILKCIEGFIKDYSPHDIFTIDIVDVDGEVSVMEYNCFNISGFYTKKLTDTVSAIHEHMTKTQSNY